MLRFAGFLVVEAHFMASYIVPLDKHAFGGLLGWVWPWAYGDSGTPGQISTSAGFPVPGFFIAVTAATLFFLAALSVAGIWVPLGLWRSLAVAGAVLSLILMVMFLGPVKLLPIAADLAVIAVALTSWSPIVAHLR